MKNILFWVLLCFTVSAQAQLYRWVDDKGGVHYTDQPPPPSAKKVEEKKFSDNVVQSDKYPYAVQQAIKNYPVTLFTGDCGEVCTLAKAYLVKRGIPFTERLPGKNKADLEQLQKVSKENLVPLLLIGSKTRLKGFTESEWASALDQAGYPKANTATAEQPKPSEPATPPAKATSSPEPKPY